MKILYLELFDRMQIIANTAGQRVPDRYTVNSDVMG